MFVIPVRKMAPQQRAVQVSLKNVTPSISEGGQERTQLEEDLKKMRVTITRGNTIFGALDGERPVD